MKRINCQMKLFSIITAVMFINSLLCLDSLAQVDVASSQVDVSSGGVSETAEVTETIKQTLPKPGNITVNFKNVDILTILNYLSEVSGVDIIPTPGVKGMVTMRLRDKPWQVALDIVTRNYGYAYSREGDIIRVMPKSMLQTEDTVTEVIFLSHIVREIELKKETTEKISEGVVEVEKKEENITKIMQAIESILSKGRGESAIYIPSANAVVVTAIPAKISSIKEMIAKIDRKPPQVLLEAKVIEIGLDDTEQLGIDWHAVISAAGARRPTTFPFTREGVIEYLGNSNWQRLYTPYSDVVSNSQNPIFPVLDTATTLFNPMTAPIANALFSFGTLDFSQFTAVLSAISDREDVNVLSTPRITTLNNQRATIKVIEKWMFQKSVSTTFNASIVTVEFEKDADAREIGIKLTIIPHVNEDDEITVNLIPEVSSNPHFERTAIAAGAGAAATTVFQYASREANTQIRVKDGETIFIGGMIRDQFTKTDDRLPILGDLFGDVPYVGKLFKYESEVVDKTEVVFFVTVHLVKDGIDSIQKSHTVSEFNKFHIDFFNKRREREILEFEEKVQEEGVIEPVSSPKPRLQSGTTSLKKAREIISVGEQKKSKKENKPWFNFWE